MYPWPGESFREKDFVKINLYAISTVLLVYGGGHLINLAGTFDKLISKRVIFVIYRNLS